MGSDLDCEESWVLNNWCFWTVVLEKTVESPWTARRSNQSILKEISTGSSLEGMMLKLKLQYWNSSMATSCKELTHWKNLWLWEESGTAEDEMAGWHHRLDGHEFEGTLWVGDGQGGLACCSSWSCKESNMTEWLNWTDIWKISNRISVPLFSVLSELR